MHIFEDATCSRNANNKINALQRMQQSGIMVNNTESVLFEWLENSQHKHFNTISRLLH